MIFPDTYTPNFNKAYEEKILEIAPECQPISCSYNDEEILGLYYYDKSKHRQIIRMTYPYEENLFYDMQEYRFGCLGFSCYFNFKLIPKELQQSQNPEDALLVLYLLVDYCQRTSNLLQLIFKKLCEDADRIKNSGYLPQYFPVFKWENLKSLKAGEISNVQYQQRLTAMRKKIEQTNSDVQKCFDSFLDIFYWGHNSKYDYTNLLFYLAEKYGIKNGNFKILTENSFYQEIHKCSENN